MTRGIRPRTSFGRVSACVLLAATFGCRRPPAAKPGSGAPPAAAAPVPLEEPSGPPSAEVQAAVQEVIDTGHHPWLAWPEVTNLRPVLQALYAAEADGLFWFAGDVPYPDLADALRTLDEAAAEGLDPDDYDARTLAKRWETLTASGPVSDKDRALFDVALSASSMRLLAAVHRGRVDPRTVGFDYDLSHKREDRAAALRAARGMGGLALAVKAAEPHFPVYHRLVRGLATYRALAKAGEPKPMPALDPGQKKVAPGKPWAGVPELAARLRRFGDLSAEVALETDSEGTPLYGDALVAAVKRFQDRHGLEADGVLGAETLRTLEVPASARVRQIELALERERWLPEMLDQPLVFVNVPLFRLWAYDPAQPDEPLRMKVVVGKAVGHATPIFIDEMEYVTFRPYWSPPLSILRAEIVPKARRDPSYLERESLEIVASGDDDAEALPETPENLDAVLAGRLYLRQRPGEKNSLGLAAFMFPNPESIYMHGTPAQQLFSQARRDFSHGCIRLENPLRLAQWVSAQGPAVDAGEDRGRHARHEAPPGQPEAEAPGDPLLRHRVRELQGNLVLRGRLLWPRREARGGSPQGRRGPPNELRSEDVRALHVDRFRGGSGRSLRPRRGPGRTRASLQHRPFAGDPHRGVRSGRASLPRAPTVGPRGERRPRPAPHQRSRGNRRRRPLFRDAFARRRCLVPADGFYEWQAVPGASRKQPHYIRLARGGLFALAGIWQPGTYGSSTCALLTTEPTPALREIHDRMPVIIPPGAYAQWLDPTESRAALEPLLAPFVEETFQTLAVGPAVNNGRTEGAICIAPSP